MSEVKRFVCDEDRSCEYEVSAVMRHDQEGDYVLYSDHQYELAALREELAVYKQANANLIESCAEKFDLLTAAEQRNAAMTDLLDSISKCYAATLSLYTLDKIAAVLAKPTESGASE